MTIGSDRHPDQKQTLAQEREREKQIEVVDEIESPAQPEWFAVCHVDEITPNTGVTVMLHGIQIAIFRVGDEQRVYALS